jgi:hypothetical protein
VPAIVSAIRIFDLDHLGAEIGQRLRTGGTGDNTGEIDDQQTIKGSRLALGARGSLRQLRSGSHIRHFPVLFYLAEQMAAATQGASWPFTGSPQITPNPDFAGRDLPLA